MHRYQLADFFIGNCQGSHLEGIQHGALAVSQVRACGADFADFFEDLLHQLEVVGRKWIVVHEAVGAVEIAQGWAGFIEADLVAQDVAFLLPEGAQLCFRFWGFAQQTLLNYFVGVGAGERQAGFEAPGDLGEVIGFGG